MTTLYISGPMTGIQEWNYPAFNEAAELLRAAGYTVLNPAENPPQKNWEDYMRVDIKQVVDANGIALLPGWHASRGARLEVHIAEQLGLKTATVDKWLHAAHEPTA